MIVMMNNTLHLVSVVINENPSAQLKGKFSCLNKKVNISEVFHCDALLLCILKNNTKVVVWNPYSGQTMWIEPRYSHGGQNNRYRYMYALGYVNKKNKSCRSHKILRFFDGHVHPPRTPGGRRERSTPENRFVWYEIYDFDSDSWTTLDVSPWYIMWCGVSLKGNTYFYSTKGGHDKGHIICFDFTRERFGPLMRLPFSTRLHEYVNLSCVREEKLAVLLTHNNSKPYYCDIWITTKIEAEQMSWNKFLTLDTYPEIALTSLSFFIDEEKKVAMGFDGNNNNYSDPHRLCIFGEDGCFRRLKLGERTCRETKTHVCSYVPSLVQIKEPARDKKQRRSNLEKRRYGEKMLRLVELQKPVRERGDKRKRT